MLKKFFYIYKHIILRYIKGLRKKIKEINYCQEQKFLTAMKVVKANVYDDEQSSI